ncbi:MAG: hypothetical protein M1838_002311 [Thelocarpon superellum]|nr:MAG: hypothetical protein M1838_002311 [Thelocarpon superellum]
MNPEPSDADVESLVTMGICANRKDAILKLRANGNDIQRTIEAIFENPSGGSTGDQADTERDRSWDESHFHTDKTQYPNQNVPSFNIHPSDDLSDTLQPNVFGAPSRPPSRVNDRETIDLTQAHAAADPSKSRSFEDREDEDLRKAMALSMSDQHPQESGVTNASGSHFGPASQDHYDTSKWSLTATRATAHEIVLDPEPADRRRHGDEPAVLIPSPSAPYLASLLTILHAIPRAREVLLGREALLGDYGRDKEWWKGTAVKVPRVVDVATHPSALAQGEILHETQRLMAFLDRTLRSYGSVDVLSGLIPDRTHTMETTVGDFFDGLQGDLGLKDSNSPSAVFFKSRGVKVSTVTGDKVGQSSTSVLELHIDNEMAESNATLYEALDDMIWDGMAGDDEMEAYLDKVADVFVIAVSRFDTSRPSRGIQMPAVWYPDRYLEQSKHLAAEMRFKKAAILTQVEEMTKMEAHIVSYRSGPNKAAVDPRDLLRAAIAHFESGTSRMNGVHDEAEAMSGQERARLATTEQLQATLDSVMEKLRSEGADVTTEAELISATVLQERKEQARESLRELSALLTKPSPHPALNPQHRYTLRGVGTDPHITYVLYPASESTGTSGRAVQEYQWWRLSYSATDSTPVTKVKVDEDLVLQAATQEGRACLLVYASDKAMDERNSYALPEALQTFVQTDNAAFRAELSGATAAGITEAHGLRGVISIVDTDEPFATSV